MRGYFVRRLLRTWFIVAEIRIGRRGVLERPCANARTLLLREN
jgi:hypothetical protein